VVEGVGIKNLTNIDKIEERYELYCAQFLTNKENLAI
jgi:hypothetical protein